MLHPVTGNIRHITREKRIGSVIVLGQFTKNRFFLQNNFLDLVPIFIKFSFSTGIVQHKFDRLAVNFKFTFFIVAYFGGAVNKIIQIGRIKRIAFLAFKLGCDFPSKIFSGIECDFYRAFL